MTTYYSASPFPAAPCPTPSSNKPSRAPIHNPYDKFSQNEFESWIGGITGALRRALGQEDDEGQSTVQDDASLTIATSGEDALDQTPENALDEDSEVEDSFAEVKLRRDKGKGRDPREGPGLGGQHQPIEILNSDSEEEGSFGEEEDEEEDEGYDDDDRGSEERGNSYGNRWDEELEGSDVFEPAAEASGHRVKSPSPEGVIELSSGESEEEEGMSNLYKEKEVDMDGRYSPEGEAEEAAARPGNTELHDEVDLDGRDGSAQPQALYFNQDHQPNDEERYTPEMEAIFSSPPPQDQGFTVNGSELYLAEDEANEDQDQEDSGDDGDYYLEHDEGYHQEEYGEEVHSEEKHEQQGFSTRGASPEVFELSDSEDEPPKQVSEPHFVGTSWEGQILEQPFEAAQPIDDAKSYAEDLDTAGLYDDILDAQAFEHERSNTPAKSLKDFKPLQVEDDGPLDVSSAQDYLAHPSPPLHATSHAPEIVDSPGQDSLPQDVSHISEVADTNPVENRFEDTAQLTDDQKELSSGHPLSPSTEIGDSREGPPTRTQDNLSSGDAGEDVMRNPDDQELSLYDDLLEGQQPIKDEDEPFPPRSGLLQPPELVNTWQNVQTYAEDFYSGGDMLEGVLDPAVVSPSHLTPAREDSHFQGTDANGMFKASPSLGPESSTIDVDMHEDEKDDDMTPDASLASSPPPEADDGGDDIIYVDLDDNEVDELDEDVEEAQHDTANETDRFTPTFENFFATQPHKPKSSPAARRKIASSPIDWNYPPAFSNGKFTTGPGHLSRSLSPSNVAPEVCKVSEDEGIASDVDSGREDGHEDHAGVLQNRSENQDEGSVKGSGATSGQIKAIISETRDVVLETTENDEMADTSSTTGQFLHESSRTPNVHMDLVESTDLVKDGDIVALDDILPLNDNDQADGETISLGPTDKRAMDTEPRPHLAPSANVAINSQTRPASQDMNLGRVPVKYPAPPSESGEELPQNDKIMESVSVAVGPEEWVADGKIVESAVKSVPAVQDTAVHSPNIFHDRLAKTLDLDPTSEPAQDEPVDDAPTDYAISWNVRIPFSRVVHFEAHEMQAVHETNYSTMENLDATKTASVMPNLGGPMDPTIISRAPLVSSSSVPSVTNSEATSSPAPTTDHGFNAPHSFPVFPQTDSLLNGRNSSSKQAMVLQPRYAMSEPALRISKPLIPTMVTTPRPPTFKSSPVVGPAKIISPRTTPTRINHRSMRQPSSLRDEKTSGIRETAELEDDPFRLMGNASVVAPGAVEDEDDVPEHKQVWWPGASRVRLQVPGQDPTKQSRTYYDTRILREHTLATHSESSRRHGISIQSGTSSDYRSSVSSQPLKGSKRKRAKPSSIPVRLTRSMSTRTVKDKGKRKEEIDTVSENGSSSSGASAASRILRIPSRDSSRASSIASTPSIESSAVSVQPSPTLARQTDHTNSQSKIPIMFHAHSGHHHHHHHGPPPPSRSLALNQTRSLPSLSQRNGPATNAKASASQRPAVTGHSPVTRSNCRFHRISLPREEDGPRVSFIVPGCSLRDREVMVEEEIEDHGDATTSDHERMIGDIESLDFSVELIAVLRLLCGVDLIRENEVFFLPEPGESYRRKRHGKSKSIAPRSSLGNPNASASQDSAISPRFTKTTKSTSGLSSTQAPNYASTSTGQSWDYERHSNSVLTHSDNEPTELEDAAKRLRKTARLGQTDGAAASEEMSPPSAGIIVIPSSGKRKLSAMKSHDSEPTTERRKSGGQRGVKRTRTSEVNNPMESMDQHIAKRLRDGGDSSSTIQ